RGRPERGGRRVVVPHGRRARGAGSAPLGRVAREGARGAEGARLAVAEAARGAGLRAQRAAQEDDGADAVDAAARASSPNVSPEQLAELGADDAGELLLEAALPELLHEALGRARRERQDERREDGDVVRAVLAVHAVLIAERVVEGLGEAIEIPGRLLELDEEQVAALRGAADTHLAGRGEVDGGAAGEARCVRDGPLDLQRGRQLLRQRQTSGGAPDELHAMGEGVIEADVIADGVAEEPRARGEDDGVVDAR